MKTLVIIYTGSLTSFSREKYFAGRSSLECVCDWAKTLPNVVHTDLIGQADETVSSLLRKIKKLLNDYEADTLAYAWGDCPFLDVKLSSELLEYHKKYRAEYTFAEGYPYGFSPEIIHSETVGILSALADSRPELGAGHVERDSLFSLLKTDINSFEIETLIAPEDYRYLRLKFCCDSKRNTLSCKRLFDAAFGAASSAGLSAARLSALAEKTAAVQRTVPAFYNIQIFSSKNGFCIYDPPVPDAVMDIEQFKTLIKNIADFSYDGVVSLSFFGDPLYHPQFYDFAALVLSNPNLSLLIETRGLKIDEELIKKIKALAGENEKRASGQRAVNWIIRLDAADEAVYKKIHAEGGSLAQGEMAVALLKEYFPQAVFPQMVRMTINENQLEGFFRKWKAEGTGELIIQKYDHVSALLPDLRTADLSPAKRFACWHIKRDMCILADGKVLRCKGALFFDKDKADKDLPLSILGNAFSESLEQIWARGEANLQDQLQNIYKGQCGVSDEYYTFNF